MAESLHNRLFVFRAQVEQQVRSTRPDSRFTNGQTARGIFPELRAVLPSLEASCALARLRNADIVAVNRFLEGWEERIPRDSMVQAMILLLRQGILKRGMVEEGLQILESVVQAQPDTRAFLSWQLPLLCLKRQISTRWDLEDLATEGNVRLLEDVRKAVERWNHGA